MNIFKQTAVFAALFVLLSIPAFAQGTGGIKGKVRNAKGDGLGGATITARQKDKVKSDAKGNFQLTGLNPGVFDLNF